MNKRAWMSMLAGVVLVAVCPAWGQDRAPAEPAPEAQPIEEKPAEELPEAEAIFERYVEAIGGREKMKEIKSLRIDGRYKGRPFKFAARLTVWKEHPSQFHLKLAEPAGETIELAFDKDMGWERQPGIGARPIQGLRLVEIKDTADFWGEANYKERYLEMRTLGEIADFGGERALVVHVKGVTGREKMLVFSAESGLFIGTRTLTVHPDTGRPAEYQSVLGPYKEFGGIKMPMGMTQRWVNSDEPAVTIEYTNIVINPEEKHDFSAPDDMVDEPVEEEDGGG